MANAKPAKWALEAAVLDARIPPQSKLIMLVLLTKAGPEALNLGRYSPGVRKVHDQTGLKVDTIVKHIRLLEQHGWLTASKQPGKRAEYALSEGRTFQPETRRKPPGSVPVRGNTCIAAVPPDGNGGVFLDGNSGVPISGNGGVPADGNESDLYRETNRYDPHACAREPDRSPSGEGQKPGTVIFDELFSDEDSATVPAPPAGRCELCGKRGGLPYGLCRGSAAERRMVLCDSCRRHPEGDGYTLACSLTYVAVAWAFRTSFAG